MRQSLYRLELIDPNNPDVIAARFRYLLRQGDTAGAQKELDRLKGMAPDSSAYQSSRTTMLLSTPDGRRGPPAGSPACHHRAHAGSHCCV